MKKYFRILSMIILSLALSACSTQDETAGVSGENYGQGEYLQGDYVYVPEFYTFEQPDNINSSEIKLRGNKLYQYNYLYDLEARKRTDQFRILSLEGDVLSEIMIDGNANVVMRCDKLYGISAASGNKEGAWAFIEHCLTEPVEWGFSPRRSRLEVQIEEAKEAAKNSSGETLYDEEGNPLPAHGETRVMWGFNGWEYTYHACTDEEIEQVMELLEAAKPVKDSDNLAMAIIEEEVQAFYAGQKSAEDVAKIIQSRVQLYVDESR